MGNTSSNGELSIVMLVFGGLDLTWNWKHHTNNMEVLTWPIFQAFVECNSPKCQEKIWGQKIPFQTQQMFHQKQEIWVFDHFNPNPSQVCYAGWCWIWVLRARWRRWGSTPRALVFKCMCQRCRGLRRVTPPCAPEAVMYTIFYYNDFYSFHMI